MILVHFSESEEENFVPRAEVHGHDAGCFFYCRESDAQLEELAAGWPERRAHYFIYEAATLNPLQVFEVGEVGSPGFRNKFEIAEYFLDAEQLEKLKEATPGP